MTWRSRTGRPGPWGASYAGELGNGTSSGYTSVPGQVTGLSSGVTAIAAGCWHSLAIQNGAAWAWGDNVYGELGNGTSGNSSALPVQAIGLSSGVTAVAGGDYFSLALMNGNVYAWGYNNVGQLGDGTTTIFRSTPELIDPTDLHNIIAVAGGSESGYALCSDGSIWDWGDNTYGELGLGNTTEYLTPQHLRPPTGYAFTALDASCDGYCALAILTPVPEPDSLSLLALGLLPLLARPRRSRSRGVRAA